jgi:hypothetical protein
MADPRSPLATVTGRFPKPLRGMFASSLKGRVWIETGYSATELRIIALILRDREIP